MQDVQKGFFNTLAQAPSKLRLMQKLHGRRRRAGPLHVATAQAAASRTRRVDHIPRGVANHGFLDCSVTATAYPPLHSNPDLTSTRDKRFMIVAIHFDAAGIRH